MTKKRAYVVIGLLVVAVVLLLLALITSVAGAQQDPGAVYINPVHMNSVRPVPTPAPVDGG